MIPLNMVYSTNRTQNVIFAEQFNNVMCKPVESLQLTTTRSIQDHGSKLGDFPLLCLKMCCSKV